MNTLNTPILFLIFNRLDTTEKVFETIKKNKPSKLYIASDGARAHKQGEKEIVQQVRNFVLENINWDCKVQTLFRQENLGCKEAVSSAISWFFKNEEMGIILEDDCLPDDSFFYFCQDLLTKYQNDSRIWLITGTNDLVENVSTDKDSYYFSKYEHIWGWASWRRAWQYYDKDIAYYPDLKEKNIFEKLFANKDEYTYFSKIYDKLYQKGIDTWDYQWKLTIMINNGLSIIPTVNLISNIGFGADATHTHSAEDNNANRKTGKITFPLQHPFYIVPNFANDEQKRKLILQGSSKLKIIIKVLKTHSISEILNKLIQKIRK